MGSGRKKFHYDPLTERKWIMITSGFGAIGKSAQGRKLHKFYASCVIAFFAFILYVTLRAAYDLKNNRVQFIIAVHFSLLCVLFIALLLSRLVYDKAHTSASEIAVSGVFRYDFEDSELEAIRSSGLSYIKKMTGNVLKIMIFGAITAFIVTPLVKKFASEIAHFPQNINPFIPVPMSLPFDIQKTHGLTIAWAITLLYGTYLLVCLTGLNEIYISCAVTLKTQLEILNHSLQTIQKRAYVRLAKQKNLSKPYRQHEIELLSQSQDYQKCLYFCLVENIKHHQAIVRSFGMEKTIYYDPMVERKWIMLSSGFGILGKSAKIRKLNKCYVLCVIAFYCFVFYITVSAAFLLRENKVVLIIAAHFSLICCLFISLLLSRLVYDEAHTSASEIAASGVFRYETEDTELEEIRAAGLSYIRRNTTLLYYTIIFGCFTAFVATPILKILTSDLAHFPHNINPYLPLPMNLPFDVSSNFGLTLAWLIVITYGTLLMNCIIGLNEIYISCTVQLRIQFQILNYSIKTIEKRACARLAKLKHLSKPHEIEHEDYQKCLYFCLVENIKHHHAILRYRKVIHPFFGSYLLAVFTLASITLAMALVAVLESPEITSSSDFVKNLIVEMGFVYSLCLYGEQVIQESSKICSSLIATPWPSCDRKFSVLLLIMLSNTLKPMQLTSRLFPVVASVESYGNIITTMYQIINVVRNT